MRLYFITLFFFLSFTKVSCAQSNMYLGVQGGLDFDQWILAKPDGLIAQKPVLSNSFGVLVGREFHNNFTIESGLIRKYYNQGYGVFTGKKLGNFSSVSRRSKTLQIPILLRAKIYGKTKKWAFTAQLGYHLCWITETGPSAISESSISNRNDTVTVWESTNNSNIKLFGLLETGIGIEWLLKKEMIFSVTSSYLAGFKTLTVLDVRYQVNAEPNGTASITNRGDYFAWYVGVRIPLKAFENKESSPETTGAL